MDSRSVPVYRSAMACLSGSRCRRYGQGSMALCRADAKVQWQIWHHVLEECRCAYNAGLVGERIDIWLWFICINSCFKYYMLIFWKDEIKGVTDLVVFNHIVFIPVWKSTIYLLYVFLQLIYSYCHLLINNKGCGSMWNMSCKSQCQLCRSQIDPIYFLHTLSWCCWARFRSTCCWKKNYYYFFLWSDVTKTYFSHPTHQSPVIKINPELHWLTIRELKCKLWIQFLVEMWKCEKLLDQWNVCLWHMIIWQTYLFTIKIVQNLHHSVSPASQNLELWAQISQPLV